jgi:glyoxylase-like metal-dependent hydrolase (beta-lactamase superfamily II)/ferredoxin
MADAKRAYAENAAGDFFVDDTCIDCDLCRQIEPSVFAQRTDHSIVYQQPGSENAVKRSAMALVTCPTGSIGTRQKHDLRDAMAAYPELIDENVYFCGFAARNSYGGASYFILRPEGNLLIDSPRFASQLVHRLEELGGVSTMFLTHRDDVADHEKFREHFGCERIIHRADAGYIRVERTIEGQKPTELDEDLLVIPTPGHTRGHAVLLYRDKYLFTGDHLAYEDDRLEAFRDVCWYSWREQTQSMKRLLDYRFEWVLPGHGRRGHQSSDVMHEKLIECVQWMEKVA